MSFLLRIDGLPTEDISPAGRRYIIGREEIYDLQMGNIPCEQPSTKSLYVELNQTECTMKAAYCLIAGFALCCCANPPKASQPETAAVTTPDTVVVPSLPDLGPWHIDVTQSYPTKEVVLQDIAEVEYIPIETNDSMLWLGKEVEFFQDDLIIAANQQCGIMVYDGQGKARHAFNHRGSGPGEYISIKNICYDRVADELFVLDMLGCRVVVYDLEGNFKRSFQLPYSGLHRVYDIVDFGPDELLAYVFDNVFARLSKKDGKLLEEKNFRKGKDVHLLIEWEDNFRANASTPSLMSGVAEGSYLAAAYASDTMYQVSPSGGWKAVGFKTPALQTMNPPVFVRPILDAPRHSFVCSIKKIWDRKADTGFPIVCYVIDKTDNRVYECSGLTDANYEGSDLLFCTFTATQPGWGVQCYSAAGLRKALEQNRLKGKLKELAAQLDEEENPVLVVYKFK